MDWRYLARVLERECGRLGGLGLPRATGDGSSLVLAPAPAQEE